MPTPALPIPWPEPIPGSVTYRRIYQDTLGRPLRGKVTITGAARTQAGDVVVPPAPVVVDVVDGTLTVDLPPDTYRITAELRTKEGAKVTDTDTITVA